MLKSTYACSLPGLVVRFQNGSGPSGKRRHEARWSGVLGNTRLQLQGNSWAENSLEVPGIYLCEIRICRVFVCAAKTKIHLLLMLRFWNSRRLRFPKAAWGHDDRPHVTVRIKRRQISGYHG